MLPLTIASVPTGALGNKREPRQNSNGAQLSTRSAPRETYSAIVNSRKIASTRQRAVNDWVPA
jgi:hypothetical protein